MTLVIYRNGPVVCWWPPVRHEVDDAPWRHVIKQQHPRFHHQLRTCENLSNHGSLRLFKPESEISSYSPLSMTQLSEPQPATPTAANPDLPASQSHPDRSRSPTPIQVPPEPTIVYPEPSHDDPSTAQVPVEENAPPRHEPRASPRPAQAPLRPTDAATAASIAATWPTKRINWPPGSESTSLIIMQAKNGPCSLIVSFDYLPYPRSLT